MILATGASYPRVISIGQTLNALAEEVLGEDYQAPSELVFFLIMMAFRAPANSGGLGRGGAL